MKREIVRGSVVLTLSSGKTIEPYDGVIGLSPGLDVFHGYDGNVFTPSHVAQDIESSTATLLTPAEQIELADYMLEQWGHFKARAEAAR
jgi:hypothetical protein